MAQGDLYRLLQRVSATLSRDMDATSGGSKRYRLRIERLAHDLHIDKKQVYNEILIQLQDFAITEEMYGPGMDKKLGATSKFGAHTGRTREQSAAAIQGLATEEGLTLKQLKAIDQAAQSFVTITRSFARTNTRGTQVKVLSDTGDSISIRITPTTETANPYNIIRKKIFIPAKAALAKALSQAGIMVSADRQELFFNVGHVTSVSMAKAGSTISSFGAKADRISKKYDDEESKAAVDLLKMEVMSRFTKFGHPEYQKQFVLKTAVVRPESRATNMTDSGYEKALLEDVYQSLKKTLESMPNDWARQKSSDSLIDFVVKDLIQTAKAQQKSANVKVTAPNLGRKNTESNKATTSASAKKPKPRKAKQVSMGGSLTAQMRKTKKSAIRLEALLPIINQRLPEVIRSHMGTNGRLYNRTGRFSESAKVISVDNANLVLGYTYQKGPYSVFERHSTRDPRPLIELSIRQIAAQHMRTRFALQRL